MDTFSLDPVPDVLDQYDTLTSEASRRVLSLLDRQPAPLSPTELAQVLAVDEGTDPAELTDDERVRYRIALVHSHLPRLADDGLVDYDGTAAILTDEGVLAVQSLTHGPTADWDEELFEAIRTDERRAVLAALTETDDSEVTLTGLAAFVAAAIQSDTVTAVDESTLRQVRRSLHHVHLPTLDHAGLVEYDVETRTVTDQSLPDSVREVVGRVDREPTPGPLLTGGYRC